MEFKNVAMIGIGAIGSVYGERIYNVYGDNFLVVAGGERGKKLKSQGITVNENTFYPTIVDPEDKSIKADFIIFAVKNNGLQQAIIDTKNIIGPQTVILPILNGVSARDELLKAYPDNYILYGLSIGIDAVREGTKVISEDMGRIQFGDRFNDFENLSDEVKAVKEVFEKSGVKHEICQDMVRTIWKKWLVNMGINQIFSITHSPYRGFFENENIRRLILKAMQEVVDVAQAKGVDLSQDDIEFAKKLLEVFPKDSKTSMHQDVEAGRKTEVEYFSGTLIKYGRELGVPTPVNDVIFDIVKGMEFIYLNQ